VAVRSIVLANQKGGVGKTTTAIHLAHGLAIAGHRTALFDLDPQGNATIAVQGMGGESHPDDAVSGLQAIGPRFWLLPSRGEVAPSPALRPDPGRLLELADSLTEKLDYLIVDCPPRLDAWGWAGIQLADEVVVPVQAEFFAMHGLSQMLASLEMATAERPGKCRLRGVLPTMVDLREPITGEILEDLRRNLGNRLLDSIILRDSCLIEAGSFGVSVFQHSPWSKGAFCYAQLIKELAHG
jgi:chromosome partitioning protein